jgi:hypothetical protein
MPDLGSRIGIVFDQLNPYNTGNLVLYFTWLVVYTYTAIAVWRSQRPWFRGICFLVNQLFSVGILMSWTLTGLLAYSYWRESLATLGGTLLLCLAGFRRRRPRSGA